MSRAAGEPTIELLPAERWEDLKPLWRELYEHHRSLTSHLREREVPFEEAWRRRRALEQEWLRAEPDSFVLAADDGAGLVGYALVRVRSGEAMAVAWTVSDPLAELVTLVVSSGARGRGVGAALLDAVEQRLRELGVLDMAISVITTNVDALRLYERRGARPFFTQLVQRVS